MVNEKFTDLSRKMHKNLGILETLFHNKYALIFSFTLTSMYNKEKKKFLNKYTNVNTIIALNDFFNHGNEIFRTHSDNLLFNGGGRLLSNALRSINQHPVDW